MKTNRTNILLLLIFALLAFSFTQKSFNNKINQNSYYTIDIEPVNYSQQSIKEIQNSYNHYYSSFEDLINDLQNDPNIADFTLDENGMQISLNSEVFCLSEDEGLNWKIAPVKPEGTTGGF